jgi:hypothetical protein|tara:strand:- start:795 stop:1040 length:246 start_codon:yes stop_codon:yes gene_type:complete
MSSKIGLTLPQRQVYDFLLTYYNITGVYPSVRDIMRGEIDDQQVIKKRQSPTSIQRMLNELVFRGWIQKEPFKHRGIKIIN